MFNPQSVVSVSPSDSSFHDRYRHHRRLAEESFSDIRRPKILHPLENEDLRLLVLENISQDAVSVFLKQGYHVDHYTKALSEDELVEKIGSYHAIGIRSKTKITQRVLQAASKVVIVNQSVLFIYLPSSLALGRRLLLYRHQSSRSCSCR
jgi:D-3-phosphoglycerate dehydrogenase / 2-oxoglutarate reductase